MTSSLVEFTCSADHVEESLPSLVISKWGESDSMSFELPVLVKSIVKFRISPGVTCCDNPS